MILWWRRRRDDRRWQRRLALSAIGLAVTGGILAVLLVEKFTEGGWVTILITGMVIAVCVAIRRHYDAARAQLRKADALFDVKVPWDDSRPGAAARSRRRRPRVVFVGKHRGVGVHALLWVLRMFPGHFKNFVFVSVGEVDAQSYGGEGALRTLRYTIENSLRFFVRYCHSHGLAAEFYIGFGTEPIEEFMKLADQVYAKYPEHGVLRLQADLHAHQLLHALAAQPHAAGAAGSPALQGAADGAAADARCLGNGCKHAASRIQ